MSIKQPTEQEVAAYLAAKKRAEEAGIVEPVRMVGRLGIKLFDENGKLKDERVKNNLIVNAGFQLLADTTFLATGRPAVVGYIGVGTGTTAPAAAQTALITQLLRAACSYVYDSGNKIATISTTFNAGQATGAITEAGSFNASTGGSMLNRVTFAVVNKGAADVMTVEFSFTLS